MNKHCYLGLAAKNKGAFKYLFAHGTWKDFMALEIYLQERYGGEAMLTKNGRSALTLALKAYFNKGDRIIINGFTCYAVYEAVKAAKMVPVFADISKDDLNFNTDTLKATLKEKPRGIIVQNTLGNPVDMDEIEEFAKKHHLLIIEDLAHSAGVHYPDEREAGTVGVATVLSFGKDKSIDTVSGGAVVFRKKDRHKIKTPTYIPRVADALRARMYPMLSGICRGLSYVHLSGVAMRMFLAMHLIERSADNALDTGCKPTKFQAKFALSQFKELDSDGEPPLREYYFVDNRDEVLAKLRNAGYYFDGLWYEKPVSPARYYKSVEFPEEDCPVAVEVSKKIINFPTYYKKEDLKTAQSIVRRYLSE